MELSESRKMTFLENLKNSREFPPGISGTIDSREFPNGNSRWPCLGLSGLMHKEAHPVVPDLL